MQGQRQIQKAAVKQHVCAGKDCTEIVKKAFEKQLAIAKVGLECELKLSKLAMENNDTHTCHFIGLCTEMKVRLGMCRTARAW